MAMRYFFDAVDTRVYSRGDRVVRTRNAIVDKAVFGEKGVIYRVLDYRKDIHGVLLDLNKDSDIGDISKYADASAFIFVTPLEAERANGAANGYLSELEITRARQENAEFLKTRFHFFKLEAKRAIADILVSAPYSEASQEIRDKIGAAIDNLPFSRPMPDPRKPTPVDNTAIVFPTQE